MPGHLADDLLVLAEDRDHREFPDEVQLLLREVGESEGADDLLTRHDGLEAKHQVGREEHVPIFVGSVRKMNRSEVEAIVRDALRQDAVIGVRLSLSEEDEGADPWITSPAGVSKKSARIAGPLPKQVRAVMANMLFIEKEGVPASLLNRLVRLAAFQNPEFFRAQAMRLSTYDKPRVISCAQEFPRHIGLPRGCREDVQALLDANGITLEMIDERQAGALLGVIFRGTLNQPQERAAQALCANDIGILSAATAFGKTVIGARMIAERGVSTLVLVHRRQLLDQWRERLTTFLEMAMDGAEKGEKLVVGESCQ